MSKKVYAIEYMVSSVVYAADEFEALALAHANRGQDVAELGWILHAVG